MATLVERLSGVDGRIAGAVVAVERDGAASPVFRAVVQEFGRKLEKARPLVEGRDDRAAWEAIVELEQAGDSAKVAAEADTGATEPTRQAVLDAHLAICMLKAEGMA
jgi:hypothetical protein